MHVPPPPQLRAVVSDPALHQPTSAAKGAASPAELLHAACEPVMQQALAHMQALTQPLEQLQQGEGAAKSAKAKVTGGGPQRGTQRAAWWVGKRLREGGPRLLGEEATQKVFQRNQHCTAMLD